jgi:hypothetical protein
VDVVHRRDLQTRRSKVDRRRQLASQVVGLGGSDGVVQRLHFLERLLGAACRFLHAADDVIAEHRVRPEQRRQRRQMFGNLRPHCLGNRPSELAQRQERLNVVAVGHHSGRAYRS